MPDCQVILASAAQLPIEDRLRLIDELASSVPDDQPPKLSKEWLEEIKHRSEEIESGAVKTESWSAIRETLFSKHGVQDAS